MDKQRPISLLINSALALVILWLTFVVYAYLTGWSGLLTLHHYEFNPGSRIRWATIYVWTPWLLLTPLVMWLAARFPVTPDAIVKRLALHVVLMQLLALAHGYLSALIYYNGGDVTEDMRDYVAWQHTGHFLFDEDMFLFDAFIYAILVASQSLSRFFHLIRQKEHDTARMQNQVAESRLQALKMQINPHFLFNTLNSIAVLVRKQETEKADAMIERLSDFFRQTLEQGDQQTVTLRQELALIEQYLAIEQVRFGERLTIDYDIDAAALNQEIPVLLLQPLVENAIKHGLARKAGPCRLAISAQQTPDGLVLDVIDDGVGTAEVAPVSGVGLRNVQERLHTLYKDRHRFAFTSAPGSGTAISIVLGAA